MSTPYDPEPNGSHANSPRSALDVTARRRAWTHRARRDLRRRVGSAGSLGMAFLELSGFAEALDGASDEARSGARQEVETRIHDSVRDSDLVCRWDADEYVVLFRGADEEECLDAIRRVQSTLESSPLCVDGRERSVSATFGVVVVNSGRSDVELEHLMELATDSVRRARDGGPGSLCVTRG